MRKLQRALQEWVGLKTQKPKMMRMMRILPKILKIAIKRIEGNLRANFKNMIWVQI